MKNSFLFFSFALLIQISVKAQVKIGDNTANINSASLLELETTDKGFVFPRISLTDIASSLPLPAGLLAGTVVYNTNAAITNGNGIGLYMWGGLVWMSINTGPISGTAWVLTGNTGTNYSTNFIGTIDKVSFRMRTNNIQRMFIDSIGSVAIGSEAFDPFNRERLLVDYGSTSSNTIANFRGNINNYLQINLQNTSSGGNASTDYVATANDGTDSTYYVDMGINSSTYNPSPANWGSAHDAYFYSNSKNLLMGTQADSSDVIFLLGGGQLKNTVLQLKGPSGAVVVGSGEGTDSAVGNIIRAPNARIDAADVAGGNLTISGGRSTGTVKGGDLLLKGGGSGLTSSGNGGNVNIEGGNSINGTDGSVSINVGKSSGDVKIGGNGNNILFSKFSTAGGLYYTAKSSGQVSTTGANMVWDSINNRLGIGTAAPAYKLEVVAAGNPLYLAGVQPTSTFTTDSILTIFNGVVKKTPYSSLTGSFSVTAPLTYNGTTGVIAINKASTSTDGYLSSTDWNTFNNKAGSIALNAPLYNSPLNFTIINGAATGTLSLATQTANTVFAGPTTGVAAAPTFRALVAADIPSLAGNYIQNQTAQQAASNFNISGNGTIGSNLSVTGTSTLTGAVTSNAGITNTGVLTSSGGIANINTASNFATNINTGTSASNVTIGGNANNILMPKFTTVGGIYYTSLATGQISTTGVNMTWDSINKRLGIGTTSPPSTLSVLAATNPLYLSGVQTTGTFTTDSILTIFNGIVKKVPYSSLPGGGAWTTTGNSGTTYLSNFIGTIDNVSMRFRTNNVQRMIIDSMGKVGIGISKPPNALSVLATDPLYLSGVQATTTFTADSILTINAGVVKKAPYSSLPSGGGGSGWLITGNSGTNPSTNFLGTTDNNALVLKVGGVQAGYLGLATSSDITVFGTGATAGSQQSTALGAGAIASQQASLAAGYKANASSQNAIAIGSNASSSVNGGIAMGSGATASSQNGIAIGAGAAATTSINTLAIGTGAKATAQNATAFGYNALASTIGANAFGNLANASGTNSLAVGNSTTASGSNSISIGDQSVAAGTNPIILGYNSSTATGTSNAIILGTGSTVTNTATSSILIGDGLTTAQSNVLILGNSAKTVGISTTTPNAAAKLDVNGAFKLGDAGTVTKNSVSFSRPVNVQVPLGLGNSIDITFSIPGRIGSTQATVAVSPDNDLPNGIFIAFARVLNINQVIVRLMNSQSITIPVTGNFYFTVTEF